MPEPSKSNKTTVIPQQPSKANQQVPLVHDESLVPSEATTASYLKATSSESTDVLEKRLESWRTVVKDLINYFDEISDTELSTSKGLEKSSSYIEIPFKEAHFFGDDSKPGIQNLLAEIRNHSHQQSLYHRESSETINNVTIKDLKALRDDIKYRIKEVKSDHHSLNSKLARTRDNSISHFKSLKRATSDPDSITSPENDPWLISHSFQRQLHKDVNEENNYNKSIEHSIKSLENFEESIVFKIKQILDNYYTWKAQGTMNLDKQAEHIKNLSGNFDNLTEWRAFSERHPGIIPMAPAKARTVEDLEKPYKNSGLLETVRTGTLERKSGIGMFKSWKEYFFVLTGSGFLHAFQNSDYSNQKEPEFSISLKKSTLSPHLEDRKDSPYAFELTDQSAGGMFSSEKTYLLRANNQSDLNSWYKDLSMRAERTLSVSSDHSGVSPYAAGALGAAAGVGAVEASRHHQPVGGETTNLEGKDNVQPINTQNAPPIPARAQATHVDPTMDTLAATTPTAAAGIGNTAQTMYNYPNAHIMASNAQMSSLDASSVSQTIPSGNLSHSSNLRESSDITPQTGTSTMSNIGSQTGSTTMSDLGLHTGTTNNPNVTNDIYHKSLEAAGAVGGTAVGSMAFDHKEDNANRMMTGNNIPNLTSNRGVGDRASTEAIYAGDGLMSDEYKRNAAIIGNTPRFEQSEGSYPDQVTITSQGQERVYVPIDKK